MAILVTMQVGPVDWSKFEAAMQGAQDKPRGRHSARVFRSQSDPRQVLIVEEWDSHDDMHAYQEQAGDDFNRRAGTEGMDWQVNLWDQASALQ